MYIMTETIIQIKKTRTDQEPHIYEIMVSKTNDHTRYFAPIEKVEAVALVSLTKNEIKKCRECGDDKKEYVRITRRGIGRQTLEHRIEEYKKNLPSSTTEKIEDYYEHITEGLLKLNDAHIVHFNIQPENIIYSDTDYCPIITDFGEAFVLEDLYNDETMRSVFSNPHSKNRCIEALCISMILEEPEWKTSQVNISKLEELIMQHFQKENDQGVLWVKYIRKIGKTKGKMMVKMLMENWYTWDLYSVNRIFFSNKVEKQNLVAGEPYKKLVFKLLE